jgi:hypothetical protein
MPVSDNELEQAVALIARDLAATLGWRPRQATAFAEQAAVVSADWWDRPGDYALHLAEDVQQQLHDTSSTPPGRPVRCTNGTRSGSSTTVWSGAAHRPAGS